MEDVPVVVVPMPTQPTGNPACPFRARGSVEFWMGVLDSPVDCLRGTVVGEGVLRTRVACFSDL